VFINLGFRQQRDVIPVSLKFSTKDTPFSILSVLSCLVSIVILT